MKEYLANCVWPLAAQLGEGPLWLAEQQRLYLVDLKQSMLHALDVGSGLRHSWPMPDYICWLIARRDGDGFMAGLRDGIARLWLEPAPRIDYLARPLDGEALRMNDAKVDRLGRLWAGSMHNLDYSQQDGKLFRLDTDHSLHLQDQGYHICNGPAFSLDGATMYHTDSYLGKIYAYPLKADGSLGPATLWRQFDAATEGSPDGMTVDSEGCLWVAQWGGARVCRYSADGALLASVPLPVSQPSSCTLGGPDLKTLYITSAAEGLDAGQLAAEPLAGALFAAEVEVAGLPPARFG